MDLSICFIVFNIFTFSLALNILEQEQGQTLSPSDATLMNAELIRRLEASDNLIQQLLGRMDYLEAQDRDHKREIQQLRKQVRDQEQRTSYLEQLLGSKDCTLCTKKHMLEQPKSDNNDEAEQDMNNQEKATRNIKGDAINKIITNFGVNY